MYPSTLTKFAVQEVNEIAEAKRECGFPATLAFDSAAAVYRAAIERRGHSTRGLTGASTAVCRTAFGIVSGSGRQVVTASVRESFYDRFPTATRLRQAF